MNCSGMTRGSLQETMVTVKSVRLNMDARKLTDDETSISGCLHFLGDVGDHGWTKMFVEVPVIC